MKTFSLRLGLLLATSFVTGVEKSFGQFTLSGEIRPRAEFRNGFKTVSPAGAGPAFFVEQRSRLNLNHQTEKLRFRLSLQDIRIWGNTSQIYKTDPSLFNVYEAYGDFRITPRMAVRVGRQELDYDNARFLGGLDWAQQGRSHDAMRWMYADTSGFSVHAGAGFNQTVPFEPAQLTSTFYSGPDNYKTMQYLWLHKDWSRGKVSFLVFNDGRQRPDTTVAYRQTYGLVGEKKVGRSTLGGELYYQGGKDPAGKTVNAWLVALSSTFATSLTPITVGGDYLSGTDAYANQNHSFTPLYGTNHAFYGFMDYFYVGSNHGQNGRTAGLVDLYLKTNFKLSKKASLLAHYHHFQSPTPVLALEGSAGTLSSRLGDELDLVYNLSLNPEVNFKIGYSHLIATESLEALKSRKDGGLNQWAWAMLTFKSVFFTAK